MILSLSANERTHVRGLRKTTCGKEVLLQLPRKGPLLDGDLLAGEDPFPKVLVKAALEDLLEISSESQSELTKAAYHLGNRHVSLEVNAHKLYLLNDTVLAAMLKSRGLVINTVRRAFSPEIGAYLPAHSHKN